MGLRALLIAAGVALVALPALAQAQDGTRMNVRGTVDKLDGQTLIVKSREGQIVSMTLPANTPISAPVRRSLADIKAGDFVGITSVKGTDGKRHALEVHFFTEAQRKTVPQSEFPYDLAPNSLMTNAIVSGIASAPQGQTLKVTFKDGSNEVVVSPDTPIVTSAPGDMSLLKPGATVVVAALKKADGSVTAVRVTAEKDGVKPPT